MDLWGVGWIQQVDFMGCWLDTTGRLYGVLAGYNRWIYGVLAGYNRWIYGVLVGYNRWIYGVLAGYNR